MRTCVDFHIAELFVAKGIGADHTFLDQKG